MPRGVRICEDCYDSNVKGRLQLEDEKFQIVGECDQCGLTKGLSNVDGFVTNPDHAKQRQEKNLRSNGL